jgi:hypothetical protein
MKKILITLFLTGALSQVNAQELGLRFGDVTGGNVAIDAVFQMGESNRIHADLSFGEGVGIDLLWDFIYEPLGEEALHWYAGVGPYTFIGAPFALGAVGEIGLEYRFNEFPLVIGADWRPYFRLIDNTNLGVNSFGVNVRWVF